MQRKSDSTTEGNIGVMAADAESNLQTEQHSVLLAAQARPESGDLFDKELGSLTLRDILVMGVLREHWKPPIVGDSIDEVSKEVTQWLDERDRKYR